MKTGASCNGRDRRRRVARRLYPGLDPRADPGTGTVGPATAIAGATRRPGAGIGVPVPVWVVVAFATRRMRPLTLTGAFELQPGPGPCGQLGSRTANRMAVPVSPFH